MPGACAYATCESKGLIPQGAGLGRQGSQGQGLVLGAKGPGVGALGGRLIQSFGMGRVCDTECAGQGDGLGVCRYP